MQKDEINREIIIDAPNDKVFFAVTDQDELTNWFLDIAVLEKKEGGRASFRFLESYKNNLIGIMKRVARLSNSLQQIKNYHTLGEFSNETVVTWRFESVGKNKTKITLKHSGFSENDTKKYRAFSRMDMVC